MYVQDLNGSSQHEEPGQQRREEHGNDVLFVCLVFYRKNFQMKGDKTHWYISISVPMVFVFMSLLICLF